MLLEVEHVVSTRFEGVCDCTDLHLDSNQSAIGACEEDVRSVRHAGVGRSDTVIQQPLAFAFAATATIRQGEQAAAFLDHGVTQPPAQRAKEHFLQRVFEVPARLSLRHGLGKRSIDAAPSGSFR
jgi:hypothetical protein